MEPSFGGRGLLLKALGFSTIQGRGPQEAIAKVPAGFNVGVPAIHTKPVPQGLSWGGPHSAVSLPAAWACTPSPCQRSVPSAVHRGREGKPSRASRAPCSHRPARPREGSPSCSRPSQALLTRERSLGNSGHSHPETQAPTEPRPGGGRPCPPPSHTTSLSLSFSSVTWRQLPFLTEEMAGCGARAGGWGTGAGGPGGQEAGGPGPGTQGVRGRGTGGPGPGAGSPTSGSRRAHSSSRCCSSPSAGMYRSRRDR